MPHQLPRNLHQGAPSLRSCRRSMRYWRMLSSSATPATPQAPAALTLTLLPPPAMPSYRCARLPSYSGASHEGVEPDPHASTLSELACLCRLKRSMSLARDATGCVQQNAGEVVTRSRARSGSDAGAADADMRQGMIRDPSPQSVLTAAGLPELEPASRSRSARALAKSKHGYSLKHPSAAKACGVSAATDPAPEAPLSFPNIPGVHACILRLLQSIAQGPEFMHRRFATCIESLGLMFYVSHLVQGAVTFHRYVFRALRDSTAVCRAWL